MNKEYLKAFYKIKDFGPVGYTQEEYNELVDIIEKALKRLEAIDSANPIEALDCLGSIYVFSDDYNDGIYRFEKERNIIKQYILKAQQQEKVLKIINEKNVDIVELKRAKTVEDYNLQMCGGISDPLNKDEFNTLKEYSKYEYER